MLDSGQSRALADPWLLNPAQVRPPTVPLDDDPVAPHRDADFKAWVGPFFMGPVNTRVVRRSAALLGYGPDFHYQEYLRFGSGALAAATAVGVSAGMNASQAALRLAPVRALARRHGPRAGAGPLGSQHGPRLVPVRTGGAWRWRHRGAGEVGGVG
jgi:short subunit dehydrogenase-like uncharacterized protein